MKKLIVKLIGFLVLVWALFAAVVYLFPQYLYNDEYGLYTNTKQHLTEPHDVLILGDSRAQAGILADSFTSDVYSLALPGGTAVEGYFVLDEYLDNNPAPEAIILSYAPYHFELGETFWERAVKFDFLSFSQGLDIIGDSVKMNDDISKRGVGCKYPTLQYGELLLYKLKFPPYYLADVSSGINQGDINKTINTGVMKEADNGKGHFYFGRAEASDNVNSETSRQMFAKSDLISHYFEMILSRCKAEGIAVYFFTAPMNRASGDAMADGFEGKYLEMMTEKQDTFSGAVIDAGFNYLQNDYFGDESHVNEKGAKWFTEYIKKVTGIE